MKKRLDILLVELGFFDSREKAKRNIMAGNVIVGNFMVDKAGTLVDEEEIIKIKNDSLPYVSRGGLKLEKALKYFSIELDNKICFDIGASTGGFTDCMLQNNAKKVYSIDVGYGQLDWKLRQNPQVISMERTNIRHLDPSSIEDKGEFATIDVSFISLRLVLPVVKNLLTSKGEIIALIKPQFEAGREEVKKHGVVKDLKVHKRVIEEILKFAQQNDLYIKGLTYSPITGPKGNIEFLAYFSLNKDLNQSLNIIEYIGEIVDKAHNDFSSKDTNS